jgi:hypothetical protein
MQRPCASWSPHRAGRVHGIVGGRRRVRVRMGMRMQIGLRIWKSRVLEGRELLWWRLWLRLRLRLTLSLGLGL